MSHLYWTLFILPVCYSQFVFVVYDSNVHNSLFKYLSHSSYISFSLIISFYDVIFLFRDDQYDVILLDGRSRFIPGKRKKYGKNYEVIFCTSLSLEETSIYTLNIAISNKFKCLIYCDFPSVCWFEQICNSFQIVPLFKVMSHWTKFSNKYTATLFNVPYNFAFLLVYVQKISSPSFAPSSSISSSPLFCCLHCLSLHVRYSTAGSGMQKFCHSSAFLHIFYARRMGNVKYWAQVTGKPRYKQTNCRKTG
jgi:hypothetical protein